MEMAKTTSYWFLRARSLHYWTQNLFLNALLLAPWSKQVRPDIKPEMIRFARSRMHRLFEIDADNIEGGIYPIEVLKPERPDHHYMRLPRLFLDALKASLRRSKGEIKEFRSKQANDYLNRLPDYYKRNFHFQTEGYLSQGSADLYGHQTEILFLGAADAMRRLVIPPIFHFSRRNPLQRPLRILELGCGSGNSTRFLKLAFPDAEIIGVDLSEPYLRVAEGNLSDFKHLSFIKADASALPFQDGHFDVVCSVFLFHELPLEIRRMVWEESIRVCKGEGLISMVDSIQSSDVPEIDELLKIFPKLYHEPYYHNYLKTPLVQLAQEAGIPKLDTNIGYLSKSVSGQTPSKD